MSSVNKNLSQTEGSQIPNAKYFKFGIVCSEWNHEITNALKEGAVKTLLANGAEKENIIIREVPGSFELTLGAQYIAEATDVDAVICLGCVIQGETRHFDFICDAVAKGITDLNINYNIPFIFGVLTPNNQQQALDRSGGKYGNKGDEAAITAIKMLALRNSFMV
ncbi:MAG: 6,7-dimethyl-8-ribityllumazine synthase [Bacteroidota bacterium]|nr:6,7-dimethyl-8-ribityllumazine synthase [Bacteroidota bacterium]MDP3144399.1 6,7-dimethyl-8-ribityllumazine synthase [Bacteroidota bacterium]MDP3555923.1 6,7-dimethyl-8-ribityllumazine synthase [Bacteroidota bacterium]